MKKKLNHKQKRTLARKNKTISEILDKTPIFQTEFWEKRKYGIKIKVLQAEQNRKQHKLNK